MNAVPPPSIPGAATALPAAPVPVVRAPAAPLPRLVIGVDPAAAKERLVLQSMIRLLDGREGLQLGFGERDTDCNLYFVPADRETRISGDCIRVRLLPPGSAAEPGLGLSLTLPLRVSPVTLLLHSAADLLAARAAGPRPEPAAAAVRVNASAWPKPADTSAVVVSRPVPLTNTPPMPAARIEPVEPAEPPPARVGGPGVDMAGVHGLFRQITTGLLAHERRNVYVGRQGAAPLLLDFGAQRVHCQDPISALLKDRHPVEEPRRATPEETGRLREQPPIRMHDLLWTSALCLGLSGAPVPPLRGRYRLTRWFDAAALSHPGVPRLAALLSTEAVDVDEAARACGLEAPTVRWLLEAAIALGIAVPVDALDLELEFDVDPAGGATGERRTIVERLRERLHRR